MPCEQAPTMIATGPCGDILVKRLKTLNKRLQRIDRAEETRSQGHKLEQDQLEAIERKGEVEAQRAEVEALLKQLCQVETTVANKQASEVTEAGVSSILRVVSLAAAVNNPEEVENDENAVPFLHVQMAHLLERLIPTQEKEESFSDYITRVREPVRKTCEYFVKPSTAARPGVNKKAHAVPRQNLLTFAQLDAIVAERVNQARVSSPQPAETEDAPSGDSDGSSSAGADGESRKTREEDKASTEISCGAGSLVSKVVDSDLSMKDVEGQLKQISLAEKENSAPPTRPISSCDGAAEGVVSKNSKSHPRRKRRGTGQNANAILNEVQVGVTTAADAHTQGAVPREGKSAKPLAPGRRVQEEDGKQSSRLPRGQQQQHETTATATMTTTVNSGGNGKASAKADQPVGQQGGGRSRRGRGGRKSEQHAEKPTGQLGEVTVGKRRGSSPSKTSSTEKLVAPKGNVANDESNNNNHRKDKGRGGAEKSDSGRGSLTNLHVNSNSNSIISAVPDDKVAINPVPQSLTAVVATSVANVNEICVTAMSVLQSRPAAERHVSVVSKFQTMDQLDKTSNPNPGALRVIGVSYYDANGSIATVIVEVWRLQRFPEELKRLLEDHTIIKVARGIGGDRDALKRSHQIDMSPVRELTRMCRDRGVTLKGRNPDVRNILNATLGLVLAGSTDGNLEWDGDVTLSHLSYVSHAALATMLVYVELCSRPKSPPSRRSTGKGNSIINEPTVQQAAPASSTASDGQGPRTQRKARTQPPVADAATVPNDKAKDRSESVASASKSRRRSGRRRGTGNGHHKVSITA